MNPATHYVRAMTLSELPLDRPVSVELEGRRIMLVNLAGEVHALSAICTHEEFDLSQGFILENAIVCPLHLSQFDLTTGEVFNPPATEPLKVFKVKIEDDTIFVEV